MIRVLQISSEVNSGSVGRIAEQIGEAVLQQGWESYIAYARDNQPSKSKTIRIGNEIDIVKHGIFTRLTDRHGFGSRKPTKELIEKIKEIKPDIIQLQHLHGYFINVELLFNYLSKSNIPVVWTFHDCWSFTGHCAHYDFINCEKWKTQCFNCPQKKEYPESLLFDNSYSNFLEKRELFNSAKNLTIVPVSFWLGKQVEMSFLGNHKIKVIHNGIDIERFNIQYNKTEIKEKLNLKNEFIVLGVASPFNKRKGFEYFIELSKMLSEEYKIILVGLSKKQIRLLPSNMIGIERTESVSQLAELYSLADVFFNPTLEEALGLTNVEAQACGTPVITFNSGGSPETIDEKTGFVVPKGDLETVVDVIKIIKHNGKEFYKKKCRDRAELNFDKNVNFLKYIEVYKKILGQN